MIPGLTLAGFQAMFLEFSNVSTSLIQTFINLINNGYNFINQNVTDSTTLNIYYFLAAHLVAVSTQPITGVTNGPSGSYMPLSDSAGLVSLSFQAIEGLSADQAFMLSTRYGQTFWTFAKQQYVQNFYLNNLCWWC